MAETRPVDDVFTSILRVLERIEERLEGQERRLSAFETLSKPSRSLRETDSSSEVDLTDLHNDRRYPSPKPSIADSVVWQASEKAEVLYSDGGFSSQDPGQIEDLKHLLGYYLGDCWKLPDDKRLRLNLANRAVDWTSASWIPKQRCPQHRRTP